MNVRFWGKSGKHRLTASISHFDPERTLVGSCGRLAESFPNKANLLTQVRVGVFTPLDAVLDQDRVEERGERCLYRMRRRCRVIDLGFTHLATLANDHSRIATIRAVCVLIPDQSS